MNGTDRKQSVVWTRVLGAGVVGICLVGGLRAQPVEPQASAAGFLVAAGFDLNRIEDAFWVCDYLGTTRGTEAVDARRCIAVSDALRELRFGNDLDRLVAWWREHKPAQHARLAAVESAAR
jgi:hypothetical protein